MTMFAPTHITNIFVYEYSMCVCVQSNTSIDGRVEEDEETFRVRLEVPETEPGVRLGVAEAIVSIIDSDSKCHSTPLYQLTLRLLSVI